MDHKFKSGDELYYVCPFVFIIDKVLISFIDVDEVTGEVHYIDHSGGYLKEWDLVHTLPEAKALAHKYLERFFFTKVNEIYYSNPSLNIEEND